jgi:hypothetical protein
MGRQTNFTTVAEPVRLALLALVRERGERVVTRELRVCSNTVARCAAGLGVQQSTATCVTMGVARMTARA